MLGVGIWSEPWNPISLKPWIINWCSIDLVNFNFNYFTMSSETITTIFGFGGCCVNTWSKIIGSVNRNPIHPFVWYILWRFSNFMACCFWENFMKVVSLNKNSLKANTLNTRICFTDLNFSVTNDKLRQQFLVSCQKKNTEIYYEHFQRKSTKIRATR